MDSTWDATTAMHSSTWSTAALRRTWPTGIFSWCPPATTSAGDDVCIITTATGRAAIIPGTRITCMQRKAHPRHSRSPPAGCLAEDGSRRKPFQLKHPTPKKIYGTLALYPEEHQLRSREHSGRKHFYAARKSVAVRHRRAAARAAGLFHRQ